MTSFLLHNRRTYLRWASLCVLVGNTISSLYLQKEKKKEIYFRLQLYSNRNLENKVASQSDKLDHIVKLLNDLSEKKSTS